MPRAAAAALIASALAGAASAALAQQGDAPEGASPTLAGTLWALERLDGAPFEARAVMAFGRDEAGEPLLRGEGPCNVFRGIYGVETPEGGMFDAGPFAATRRACPDLAAESAFFAGLEGAVRAEIVDGRLILEGPDDARMEFSDQGPAVAGPPSDD
jgi:heat shock protein HslJ